MKKKLFYLVCFVTLACSVTSCDALLKNCQTCKLVTRTSGGTEVTAGSDSEYCGTDLVTVKATATITDPLTGNKTKYECR
jgi:hypothetical protein